MAGTEWVYDAVVVAVVDGDTVKVDVDLGFKVHLRVLVRVDGINAPEKNTGAGRAAKAWAETVLPPGTKVTLATRKPDADDKYGRWLAAVSVPARPGIKAVDFGPAAVAAGHARVWDGTGAKPT